MKFKELIEAAKAELQDISTVENPDFRLEEAVYNKQSDTWDVVVSYLVDNLNPGQNPLESFLPQFRYQRIYKRLEIDQNKKVLGFYIHEDQ